MGCIGNPYESCFTGAKDIEELINPNEDPKANASLETPSSHSNRIQ